MKIRHLFLAALFGGITVLVSALGKKPRAAALDFSALIEQLQTGTQ